MEFIYKSIGDAIIEEETAALNRGTPLVKVYLSQGEYDRLLKEIGGTYSTLKEYTKDEEGRPVEVLKFAGITLEVIG